MANNENLKKGIATQFQSGEEAARNGAKGGKIAAQKRRQKREMREAAKTLLEMAVPPTMPKPEPYLPPMALLRMRWITTWPFLLLK